MKKFLLFAAAALMAASASAKEVVVAETDFATADGYYFWKSDVTNAELKDGGLTITNDAATANFWDIQYMVLDNMQVTAGVEYTVSVKIKGFSGPLHYVLGAWGNDVFAGAAEVEASSDWQTVTFSGVAPADVEGGVHLLLQTGEFVGSYTIASAKMTYVEEDPINVIAETDFATADGYYFWKSDVTNAEIKDGGLTITNDAVATNFWDVQYMVLDNMSVVAGTEYFVDIKIKGFSGPLHYVLGAWGNDVFAGAAEVEASSDWQTITFSGVAPADIEGGVHLLLQSGEFVGSYTIANAKMYTVGTGAVEAVSAAKVVVPGVYNMQGVKVADSLDEVTAPGLYISNGKKIVKK